MTAVLPISVAPLLDFSVLSKDIMISSKVKSVENYRVYSIIILLFTPQEDRK